LDRNENKSTSYHHLWDAAKEAVRGKFTVVNDYKKINDLKSAQEVSKRKNKIKQKKK
jgi:hypothetical protein